MSGHNREAQKRHRAEKRAAALRENLKRRKAQTHERLNNNKTQERLNEDKAQERRKENDDDHSAEQDKQPG